MDAARQLKLLLDATPTVVYVLQAEEGDFPCSWISENVQRVLGFSPEEVGDPHWWRHHVHPQDLEPALREGRALLEKGQGVLEYRFRSPWGHYVWLKDERKVVRDSTGRPLRVFGSFHDITESYQAEELLRRLTSIVECSEDAIVGLALDGVVTSWNKAAEHLLGFDSRSVVGQSMDVLTPAECREEARGQLERVRKGERPTLETRRLTRDGRHLDVSVTLSPYCGASGAVVGALCVMRDITERMGIRAQVDHSQRMEAVVRLAGGVAHEFNNLLTVINGYAHLLMGGLRSTDPVCRGLREIVKAADQAISLTRQMQAFSGRQPLAPVVFDLNSFMRAAEPVMRRLLGDTCTLDLKLVGTPWKVRLDRNQLELVLMNLVVHARESMASGGTLTLETRNLEITPASSEADLPRGAYVSLVVRDSGPGMDAETCAHIFEPFYGITRRPPTAHAVVADEAGAEGFTGMGLAAVYGIVKQSGGILRVASRLGSGATFTIYLPRVEDAAGPRPVRAQGSPPRGDETVLLVEDEQGLRNLARLILKDSGYTVLEAQNGEEALRICEQHVGAIHVLVTDVAMPVMSGPEIAAHIVQRRPAIRTLFISGSYDEKALKAGGPHAAFLPKPFPPRALVSKVREILDADTGQEA